MKMLIKPFTYLFVAVLANMHAVEKLPSIGIVNFATCIQESRFGKQEQDSLESLKNQLQKTAFETFSIRDLP